MNTTLEALKELLEYSKALKCDIIRVKDNIIYGTDSNFVHLRVIRCSNEWSDMIFYLKDLSEFIKQMNMLGHNDNALIFNIVDYISIHYEHIDTFDKLILSVNWYINNPISFSNEDLKSNDNFNTINAMKAGDGIGLLRLSDKHILTLFSGLLPINKNDKVMMSIRDIDTYRYLANFTIIKKKFSIDVYFMYLFLD